MIDCDDYHPKNHWPLQHMDHLCCHLMFSVSFLHSSGDTLPVNQTNQIFDPAINY